MPQKSPKIAEPIDLPCSIVKTFIGEMTIRYKFVVRNNTRQAIAPGKTIEWKLSGYKRQIAGQGFALVTLKEEGKYILSQPLGSSGSVVFKTADETRNGAFEKKYEKCIAVIPAVSDK